MNTYTSYHSSHHLVLLLHHSIFTNYAGFTYFNCCLFLLQQSNGYFKGFAFSLVFAHLEVFFGFFEHGVDFPYVLVVWEVLLGLLFRLSASFLRVGVRLSEKNTTKPIESRHLTKVQQFQCTYIQGVGVGMHIFDKDNWLIWTAVPSTPKLKKIALVTGLYKKREGCSRRMAYDRDTRKRRVRNTWHLSHWEWDSVVLGQYCSGEGRGVCPTCILRVDHWG